MFPDFLDWHYDEDGDVEDSPDVGDVGGGGSALDTDSDSEDYGSLVSRYSAAGLDLKSVDPVELSKAHALYSRVGDEPVHRESELGGLFNNYIARLTASDQGRAYLSALVGQITREPENAGFDSEELDPAVAQRLSQMQQLLQQQQQQLEELNSVRMQITTRDAAKQVTDGISKALESATGAVEGARGHAHLERDFWTSVAAGAIPDHAMTPAGIRAWVQSYVKERGTAQPRRQPGLSRASRAAPSSRGKSADKKVTPDDVTEMLTAALKLS